MDRNILIQYTETEGEVKDLRERIDKLQKKIDGLHVVSDSVKGTRRDGTYGSIAISGYPTPEFYNAKAELEKYKGMLKHKEFELLQRMNWAEEYIETIEKPELRTMFRIFFIDGCNLIKTADRLNEIYPSRETKFTDANIRMRIQRYFGKM